MCVGGEDGGEGVEEIEAVDVVEWEGAYVAAFSGVVGEGKGEGVVCLWESVGEGDEEEVEEEEHGVLGGAGMVDGDDG